MDPLLEIRKLSPSVIRHLGSLLDYGDQWKDLMGKIPKQLPKTDFEAYISDINPAKYTADDIQTIAQGAIQLKKSPTAILIDEWGTSGRPRANLGHLVHLLTQANLFRAADYVSVDLLQNPPVNRPTDGPASTIKLEINDWMQSEDRNPGLGTLLEMIDYSGFEDISESLDCEEIEEKYPEVDSETKSVTDRANSEETVQKQKSLKNGKRKLLKGINSQFSETSLENSSVPPISMLLEEVQVSPKRVFTEKCDDVLSSPGKSDAFEDYSNIPAFSKILTDNQFLNDEKVMENVENARICDKIRRNSL